MNVQGHMHYTSLKKWTGYLNFLLIKEKIKTLFQNRIILSHDNPIKLY